MARGTIGAVNRLVCIGRARDHFDITIFNLCAYNMRTPLSNDRLRKLEEKASKIKLDMISQTEVSRIYKKIHVLP